MHTDSGQKIRILYLKLYLNEYDCSIADGSIFERSRMFEHEKLPEKVYSWTILEFDLRTKGTLVKLTNYSKFTYFSYVKFI